MEEALDLTDDAGLEEIVEIDDQDEVIEIEIDEPEAPIDIDTLKMVEIDPVKEARRRQRRRMHRLLNAGANPSFTAIISAGYEDEDDEDPPPKRIRIDVNKYLGLVTNEPPSLPHDDPSLSDTHKPVLPADEGYFEGTVAFSLPEDGQHLNELHLLIREQLEMFSATDDDVLTTQAGRRNRTVRGKVGARCIHCAKVCLAIPVKDRPWPPGSISYPVNIAGIYPVCSQKPQLHFESCPHTPQDIKGQLYRLANDPTMRRQKATDANAINTNLYYAISARRIGLVDVEGGMRFGRDLTLEPLSLESVKVQVENDVERFTRKGPVVMLSKPEPPAESTQPRIKADEESEKVLAEIIAEKGDPRILGRADDIKLVSDCIFICVRSMVICNAVPADFETRGKKTKMMRLGFAGFCCRYCNSVNNPEVTATPVDYSCRSFSSHPDNLSSAISNSFYLHLQKCYRAPVKIRKALAVYKRLHSRQMAKLPFGAQRKLFYALWARLRAHDITKEEMMERIKQFPQPITPIPSTVVDVAPTVVVSNDATPDIVASTHIEGEIEERSSYFPFCDDEETKAVIRAAKDQDPSINNGLILASDEHLITEYVFLMMKQLKIAYPNAMDFSRGKRTTVLNVGLAGMCCRHCCDQDQASSGGRTFPSAPDNMASSLNTSLFQHMQRCASLSSETKRALATTKKVHSHQCANLKFGSQRRYFNLVFQRIQAAETNVNVGELARVKAERTERTPQHADLPLDDPTFADHNFIAISTSCFECMGCRMVPLTYRAANAISIGVPTVTFMQAHETVCKQGSFDLSNVVQAVESCFSSNPALSLTSLRHADFVKVLNMALGSNPRLIEMFTEGVLGIIEQKAGTDHSEVGKEMPYLMTGLHPVFPTPVDLDQLNRDFQNFAESIPGMEVVLIKNPSFLRLFRIMSPFLLIPHRPLIDLKPLPESSVE